MTVKTCRMDRRDPEYGDYKCEFCGNPAHYWSQNGTKDGHAIGVSVYHCQGCRKQGRSAAAGINAKINYRGKCEDLRKKGKIPASGLFRLFR